MAKPRYCPNCGDSLGISSITSVGAIHQPIYEITCPKCFWLGDVYAHAQYASDSGLRGDDLIEEKEKDN